MQVRLDQEGARYDQIVALGLIKFLKPSTYVLQQNLIDFD